MGAGGTVEEWGWATPIGWRGGGSMEANLGVVAASNASRSTGVLKSCDGRLQWRAMYFGFAAGGALHERLPGAHLGASQQAVVDLMFA